MSENEKLESILQSNQYIRHRVQDSVNEFLRMREDLVKELQLKSLEDISKEFSQLINAMNIETLNSPLTSEKVQLVITGENSSGKTSFIHLLLNTGDMLPADVGPVTARIIKMTYAKAEDACVLIYPSIEASFNKNYLHRVDLSKYFLLNDDFDEPDWYAIGDCLSEYVRRPENLHIHSQEFADWAKHFIELYFPSRTLELGIDVYDTAGFRIRDAQILKDNLFDLVRLIKPTLVFLYDNPSSTDETNECFLALKKTLKTIDTSNIFFLNTKADIERMPDIHKVQNQKQFLDLFNQERIKRYGLLLKTPGMSNSMSGGLPKSFEQCHCFDICSAHSQEAHEYGPMMNRIAINRLIQFVANSDLIMVQRVSNLVVPAVEAFFDLILVASHRTKEQLKQLKRDAHLWIESYFEQNNRELNRLLEEIFRNILQQFSSIKQDLIRRASQQRNSTDLKTFLHLAIQHEIMKGVVYDALGSMSKDYLDSLIKNHNLILNATSNELLIQSLKISLGDQLENIENQPINKGTLQSFIIQTFTRPVFTVTDLLFNETNDQIRVQSLSYRRSRPSDIDPNFDSQAEAKQYLIDIEQQILSLKDLFLPTISKWSLKQKSKIMSLIEQQHRLAMSILPVRHQAFDILQKYVRDFFKIESQLEAAQDLAKFNGEKPLIHSNSSSTTTTTVYTIEPIQWGSQTKNLFVKRLTNSYSNQSYFSYYEAHYHRKITNLNIPNTIKLTYLYENQLNSNSYELWMIFHFPVSNIQQNLKEFLNKHARNGEYISMKKAIQLVLPIMNALTALHENELVHGNLITTNILLDDNDQSYLADLGDWIFEDDRSLIDKKFYHQISDDLENLKKDINDFGYIGLKILSLVDDQQEIPISAYSDFKNLMNSCIKDPLKSADIRYSLELLSKDIQKSSD